MGSLASSPYEFLWNELHFSPLNNQNPQILSLPPVYFQIPADSSVSGNHRTGSDSYAIQNCNLLMRRITLATGEHLIIPPPAHYLQVAVFLQGGGMANYALGARLFWRLQSLGGRILASIILVTATSGSQLSMSVSPRSPESVLETGLTVLSLLHSTRRRLPCFHPPFSTFCAYVLDHTIACCARLRLRSSLAGRSWRLLRKERNSLCSSRHVLLRCTLLGPAVRFPVFHCYAPGVKCP